MNYDNRRIESKHNKFKINDASISKKGFVILTIILLIILWLI